MIPKYDTRYRALSTVAVVLLVLVVNLTSTRFRTEFGATATGISSSICISYVDYDVVVAAVYDSSSASPTTIK